MSFLKPKAATSSSSNTNNGLLTSTYGGTMNAGTGATNILQALLTGGGDQAGANAGLEAYKANAGFAPAMEAMTRGTVGQGASAGILNSGTTARALQSRGADINQGYYNNYLQQLSGLAGQGLQAGGLIANAGQTSQSKGGSPSTLGSIASTVGGIASIFSDRRLKTEIEKVDEFEDGLGIYRYRYLGRVERHTGVMADEVEKLRPWALGPIVNGYSTVNYEAL